MDIRDGFIIGIYNYCDSWCDRCAFTSRCHVFADVREMEAAFDPNLAPVAKAPQHPSDIPPPPPDWLKELLDEMEKDGASSDADDACDRRKRRHVPERDAIDRRAEEYSRRVREWLGTHESDTWSKEDDPREVIAWFHMLIHVKAMRALTGLAEDDPADREWPPDHDGSAKVALIGIDRSHTAWLDLVEVGTAAAADVEPFVDELVWLRSALERTFPNARAFVRPGFDEPEAVARLLRSESEA